MRYCMHKNFLLVVLMALIFGGCAKAQKREDSLTPPESTQWKNSYSEPCRPRNDCCRSNPCCPPPACCWDFNPCNPKKCSDLGAWGTYISADFLYWSAENQGFSYALESESLGSF